jgi:histidinol dehydrogenase
MKFIKEASSFYKESSVEVQNTVSQIIKDIRQEGWEAVKKYALSLDKFSGSFQISKEELYEAEKKLTSSTRKALERAIRNVRTFHSYQKKLFQPFACPIENGVTAALRFIPVERAAVYVPAGRYPLPSTAVMGVVPAQEAGVSEIVLLSPPTKEGSISPIIAATASLLGVSEVWALGGAHGIAAMALGAGPVKKVDMIVGPGNAYVTEAKRLLSGEVGIDGLAGPSEVLIIADETANPLWLAADIAAQSEHDPMAASTLLCTDEETALKTLWELEALFKTLDTAETIKQAWKNNGTLAICSLDEAIQESNRRAPEHLQLCLRSGENILNLCTAYGAAFVGNMSPVPFGDYIGGTNHTLPTQGRARFSGGLWTGTFLRPLTSLTLNSIGASSLSEDGITLAETEGLKAHSLSMALRRNKL